MAFLKLLLNSYLTIITITVFFTDGKTELVTYTPFHGCFLDYIKPINYHIKLHIEKYDNIINSSAPFQPYIGDQRTEDVFILQGECDITINITRSTRFIHLIIEPPILDVNTYDDVALLFKLDNGIMKSYTMLRTAHHAGELGNMQLDFGHELRPGLYILRNKFMETTTDMANYLITSYINEGNRTWLFAANNLTAFIDHFKFPYCAQLKLHTMFTIESTHKVYCMYWDVPAYFYDEDTIIRSTFNFPPDTSATYLIVTELPRLILYNDGYINVWYRYEIKKDMEFALNVIKIVDVYLEYEWHMKSFIINHKKYSDMIHIIHPNFPEGATVPRFIFYRMATIVSNTRLTTTENGIYEVQLNVNIADPLWEEDLMYNKTSNDTQRMVDVTRLITRNIINQWFHDIPSWIIEGLATILEAYAIDKVLPDFRVLDLFVVQSQHESFRFDCAFDINLLQRKNRLGIDSFSGMARYIKAPFILRMLQHLIPDAVFRHGIYKYFNIRELKWTSIQDFWNAMENAVNEFLGTRHLAQYRDVIITIMMSWINQKHYPVVTVTRYYDQNLVKLEVRNCHLQNVSTWLIAVTYAKAYPDFNNLISIAHVRLISSDEFLMTWSECNCIIVNLRQIGYYRVNYDYENWRRIASYLDSLNYEKIHVLNRAQIIDDAFHFVIEKELNFTTFLMITKYISRETDYIAWYPMFKVLEYMSSIFPLPDSRVKNIKQTLEQMFDRILYTIEYEKYIFKDYPTKCLWQEITKWACTLGHSKCMNMANYQLQLHLTDPEKHKLLPEWKQWTYCKGLMSTDKTTWRKTYLYANETRNIKIFEYLACPQSTYRSTVITEYIRNMMWKVGNKQDSHGFLSIIAKQARNDEMLDIILNNFRNGKPERFNTVATIFIIIINHVYSVEKLHKIMAFEGMSEPPSLKLKIEHKVEMRLIQIKNQMNFFEIFPDEKVR